MRWELFFIELLSYLAFLPAGILCYLPMGNQLRYSRRRIALTSMLLLALLLPLASWLSCRFSLGSNGLTLPVLLILFLSYHRNLRVPLCKSVAVFALACALMGFLSNYANGFDALLRPFAEPDTFSIEGALFQFGISSLAALLFALPLRRYGSLLVDSFDLSHVWYITVLVSGLFLGFNISIVPHNYQILYTNRVFFFFWVSLTLLLLLMLLLCVLFYFIVSGMLTMAKTAERNRILEMQESQYTAQQKYLENSAKARHDFKQTIRALKGLSDAGDYQALDAFLTRYAKTLPQNDVIQYCKNNAVNALLNYYAQSAIQNHIELNWRIELPEPLPITDVDLCGTIGNILENATTACLEISDTKRWIQLTITTLHSAQLCIVATNSFSGIVRKKEGQYLSIHRNGNGVGLLSIRSTAEKYGGSAEFSHQGREFYTDVMMPIY